MTNHKRYLRIGEPAYVTACGLNGANIFHDESEKRKYLERFALVAGQDEVAVHAYALLDDQLHFLLVPTQTKDAISRLFRRVQTWWAQSFNSRFNSRFDSCLVDSGCYFAAMRHIDLSPKRAGIVAEPGSYKFSSARTHLTGGIDPFFALDLTNWRQQFSGHPGRYHEFLQETSTGETQRIEKAVRSGFPLGSEAWVAQLEKESGWRLHPLPPGRRPLKRLAAQSGSST